MRVLRVICSALMFMAAVGPRPPPPEPNVTSLHVVYMTHLDLGFTQATRSVCSQYFNILFPKAFNLSAALRRNGSEAQFRWTQFPWMIQEFLDGYANCAWGGGQGPNGEGTNRSAAQIAQMEEAIKNDDMIWQATAVNFFPEILDEEMWDYTLGMGEKLNKKYGKSWGRLVGKHSDVPGMSRSAIPALVKHGLKAYHIGYNPSCTRQFKTLPEVFRWKLNETGDEILMMLNPYYGTDIEVSELDTEFTQTSFHRAPIPGAEQVGLVFQYTVDNGIKGFPSVDTINQFWAGLKTRFPNADIKSTSLDDFVEEVLAKGNLDALPVVTGEIGDSWLYGPPADPIKVATFREARRAMKEAVSAGKIDPTSAPYERYMRRLIKGPAEHNWGMDSIRSSITWNTTDFNRPGTHHAAWEWAGEGEEWAAQREWMYPCTNATASFLNKTCVSHPRHNNTPIWHTGGAYATWDGLPSPSTPQWDAFVAELQPRLHSLLRPQAPNVTGEIITPQQLNTMQPATCGGVKVAFSGADGSIRYLEDTKTGQVWVGGPQGNGTQRLAQFHYRSYSADDCGVFSKEYCLSCHQSGNTSTGSPPLSQMWHPKVLRAGSTTSNGKCLFVMDMGMDSVAHTVYGAPGKVSIEYTFPGSNGAVADVSLVWADKTATGLPEAMWMSFVPEFGTSDGASWAMDVMGHPVDPLDVVAGGTRHLHAVESGVELHMGARSIRIETLDTPIVSPGDANHLLRYVDDQPDIRGGMHFDMHSNIWPTAFPKYYGYDGLARFRLHTN